MSRKNSKRPKEWDIIEFAGPSGPPCGACFQVTIARMPWDPRTGGPGEILYRCQVEWCDRHGLELTWDEVWSDKKPERRKIL